jgi:hypothetical protein
MPSFPYTPGALTLTGGTFNPEPIRFTYTPGALTLSGASIGAGPGLGATDGEKLARLMRQQSYFDEGGRPTSQMQIHWQRTMERIEQRFTDIESVLAQVQAAQTMAAAAQQSVLVVEAKVDLANSYTDPVAGLLTGSSAGVVTIASHSRVYGDGTTVAVTGGSVSGFTSGQFVRVYYVDAARAGGAVTYLGTTSEVIQQGDTHVVGGVTIPVMGEADATGAGTVPPGYVPDYGDLDLR